MAGFLELVSTRTLLGMAKRQSRKPEIVLPGDAPEEVQYFASKIRARMDLLGWKTDRGAYDVKKLQAATKIGRWQTAQYWVEGRLRKLPPIATVRRIAGALGVDTEELIGIALGKEATNAAWTAFLDTAEGRSMSPEERRIVGTRTWGDGREPSILSYQLELMAFRSTKLAS